MQHAVDGTFEGQGLIHVMPDELKIGVGLQMRYILERTGKKVVQAEHGMALEQQAVAHMRANKTGGSGNNNSQVIASQRNVLV